MVEGGINPRGQIVTLQAGTGQVAWTAAADATWLSCTPGGTIGAGGSAPMTVSIIAAPGAGIYNGTITVRWPDAPQVVIAVTLQVGSLSIGPGSLTFAMTAGDGNPPGQTV